MLSTSSAAGQHWIANHRAISTEAACGRVRLLNMSDTSLSRERSASRSFESSSQPLLSSRREQRPSSSEDGRRYGIRDGLFQAVAQGGGEQYLSAFALLFHATPFHLSLLSAVPQLVGTWAQLLSVKVSHWFPDRKSHVLWGMLGQAIAWIPILVLPFLCFPRKPVDRHCSRHCADRAMGHPSRFQPALHLFHLGAAAAVGLRRAAQHVPGTAGGGAAGTII